MPVRAAVIVQGPSGTARRKYRSKKQTEKGESPFENQLCDGSVLRNGAAVCSMFATTRN